MKLYIIEMEFTKSLDAWPSFTMAMTGVALTSAEQ